MRGERDFPTASGSLNEIAVVTEGVVLHRVECVADLGDDWTARQALQAKLRELGIRTPG